MRRVDVLGWIAVIVTGATMLFAGMNARGQENIIPVPESQLRQLLTEHAAALEAIGELQKEVSRLKVKLACA